MVGQLEQREGEGGMGGGGRRGSIWRINEGGWLDGEGVGPRGRDSCGGGNIWGMEGEEISEGGEGGLEGEIGGEGF